MNRRVRPSRVPDGELGALERADLELKFFSRKGSRGSQNKGNGVPDRIRTCDLRIRNPMLYPAELRGHRCCDICYFRDWADYLFPQ